MKIPFHKPNVTQKEIDSVVQVIRSGWLTMGPKTIEFENKFKNFIGSNYAISVNSATSALHLALSALGVVKGDEVIIPTNTFIATAEAVTYLGAVPILCDIEPQFHNIDTSKIEALITNNTKAIIPVHFGGNPCLMDEISLLAKKYNLKIIEDAAHALPSYYNNRIIGSFSDAVCFSFYATKTLSTGEGGMITTNDKKIARKIKLQRLHGINRDSWDRYDNINDWYYEVVDLGYKYNTTDFQSALGIIQLERLQCMKKERLRVAMQYYQAFKGKIDFVHGSSDNSSLHLFVIRVSNRDELYQKLKSKGIITSVHFIPVHVHPFYKNKFSYNSKDFPIANNIFKKSLSLPIYPDLTIEQTEYVINNVLAYAVD